MILGTLVLLQLSASPVTVSSVRLEAENDRPVLRAAVSGPVLARVERDGRDLLLVLPGARAAVGLVLPEPVAEIQALTLEQKDDDARIRIHLEGRQDYELQATPGLVSVVLRPPSAPAGERVPEDVRDLYVKLLPPPAGGDTDVVSRPLGEAPADRNGETGGLRIGFLNVKPSVLLSYIDGDAAFLDTPLPVREKYFQVEPTIVLSAGSPGTEASRFQLSYGPRFRTGSEFQALRVPSHLATASLDVPVGTMLALHASHHFAHGVLETTEVDPGREYFFRLSPFTRNDTELGAALNPNGRLGLEVAATRDATRLDQGSGFFDHRTDTVNVSVDDHFGVSSRVYLRYEWQHVPPSAERPIVESSGSSYAFGASGELLPLLTGNVLVGLRSLSAPQAGPGGRHYGGSILAADLKKEFSAAASLTLLAHRDTYPSGFETNAFYVVTGVGAESDLGLPFALSFHGALGWQRNSYQVQADGFAFPRQDRILGWSVGLGHAVTRWGFLRADYRHDRRTSNLTDFDTSGHVFVLSLGVGTPQGMRTR